MPTPVFLTHACDEEKMDDAMINQELSHGLCRFRVRFCQGPLRSFGDESRRR